MNTSIMDMASNLWPFREGDIFRLADEYYLCTGFEHGRCIAQTHDGRGFYKYSISIKVLPHITEVHKREVQP